MLTAIPKAWFSWDFTVLEGAQPVADIDVSWWRESGSLRVQGTSYQVYREGVMSGAFILESAGTVLARAEKPSAFRRLFLLEHAGRQYTLRSAFWGRFLLSDDSREIGSLSRESIFMRRARVDLPEDLPLSVRIFIVWLAVIMWKRDSDSAGAASASA